MGHYYPALVELVKQCLHNAADQRPATNNLLVELQRMRDEVEGDYGGPFKLDMVRVRLAKEVKIKDRQLTRLQVKIAHASYKVKHDYNHL